MSAARLRLRLASRASLIMEPRAVAPQPSVPTDITPTAAQTDLGAVTTPAQSTVTTHWAVATA